MVMAWDDQFWDNLLFDIEDGLVVPVVGRDVLKVHYQDQKVLLYPLLAQKLAETLRVSGDDLPERHEINAVVGRYLPFPNPWRTSRRSVISNFL